MRFTRKKKTEAAGLAVDHADDRAPKVHHVSHPKWANAERTAIDCTVKLSSHGDELLPFTADPKDRHGHGRAIFDACTAGKFGPVADYDGKGYEVSQ